MSSVNVQDSTAVPQSEEPTAPSDQAAIAGDHRPAPRESALVLEDLLVEDISIDGMCGVY